MAKRRDHHLASGVFASSERECRGIWGMQQDRRALVTGSAVAIAAWVIFLVVLWSGVSPR